MYKPWSLLGGRVLYVGVVCSPAPWSEHSSPHCVKPIEYACARGCRWQSAGKEQSYPENSSETSIDAVTGGCAHSTTQNGLPIDGLLSSVDVLQQRRPRQFCSFPLRSVHMLWCYMLFMLLMLLTLTFLEFFVVGRWWYWWTHKIIRRRMAPCDVLTNCSLGAFLQVQKNNIQAYWCPILIIFIIVTGFKWNENTFYFWKKTVINDLTDDRKKCS